MSTKYDQFLKKVENIFIALVVEYST